MIDVKGTHLLVEIENNVCSVRNKEASFVINISLLECLHFLHESSEVDNNTISDNALCLFVEDT
jgi:hypothetical protein